MTFRRLSSGARHVAAAFALAAMMSAGGDALAQQWTPRAPAGQPTPDQIAEARERYDRGVQLYEVEGDVGGAMS